MLESFSLEGKTALIAGYFDGVAEAVSLALAEAGADVALAPANDVVLTGLEARVKELGRRLMIAPTNATDAREVQSTVKKVVSEFEQIDILVNSCRFRFAKPFLEISEDEWRRTMDMNLTGAFLCLQVAGEQMVRQQRGRIVNLISALAERGLSNCAALCASLGGVRQLTQALAIEWARHGIRVNAIAPGWLTTEALDAEESEATLLKYIPAGRRGQPEEVGVLAVLLTADSSHYINGQTFLVDGGLAIRP